MTSPEGPRPITAPHRLYVHLAWATLGRVPTIGASRRAAIETHMMAVCRRLGVEPVEARALGDRVHLLAGIPASVSVLHLGLSVREDVTTRLASAGVVVRWSPGFAAISVSPSEVRRVRKRLARLEDGRLRSAGSTPVRPSRASGVPRSG